jgi:hypothetical protein
MDGGVPDSEESTYSLAMAKQHVHGLRLIKSDQDTFVFQRDNEFFRQTNFA